MEVWIKGIHVYKNVHYTFLSTWYYNHCILVNTYDIYIYIILEEMKTWYNHEHYSCMWRYLYVGVSEWLLFNAKWAILQQYHTRNLTLPPVFSWVCVAWSLVYCVMFCRSLFVLFLWIIVLSVLLRFTASDYPLVSSNLSYQASWTQVLVSINISLLSTLCILVWTVKIRWSRQVPVLPSTHVTPGLTLVLYGSWGCPTFVISYIFQLFFCCCLFWIRVK